MKVAVIADSHWGVRNDSVHFMDMSKNFLDNVFFPKIREHGVKQIVHLGDLVDRRKYINIQTANRLRRDFLEPIKDQSLELHMILGNHDVYYKNTNAVNAIQELCDESVKFYQNATEVLLNEETPVLFVPWICAENRQHSMEMINNSKSTICMGHLELQGFEMFRGSICSHGDDRTIFDKFHMVLSGHFHHRSTDGHIVYTGSHGQFTWSDYDDSRGFHLLDLETKELTFIENPYIMFSKAWYDDSTSTLETILDYDFSKHKGTYVKVVVKNKSNPFWFDKFCEQIEKVGILNLQIVEDHLNLNLEEDSEIVSEAESTLSIFMKHIGQVNSPNLNKEKLERVIVDLYNRALTVE
jgi:DNA repair exonuclease SbcCD nuclease subunit